MNCGPSYKARFWVFKGTEVFVKFLNFRRKWRVDTGWTQSQEKVMAVKLYESILFKASVLLSQSEPSFPLSNIIFALDSTFEIVELKTCRLWQCSQNAKEFEYWTKNVGLIRTRGKFDKYFLLWNKFTVTGLGEIFWKIFVL